MLSNVRVQMLWWWWSCCLSHIKSEKVILVTFNVFSFFPIPLGTAGSHGKGKRKNSGAIFPSSLPMRPRARLNLIPNFLSSPQKKHLNSDWVRVWFPAWIATFKVNERGEFHISHDATLHTILLSFRTRMMLSVQQERDSRTAVEIKATCFADKTFCTFAVSIYLRFSFYHSKYISCFCFVFASVRPVLTCVDKALHGLTSDFHVLVLK